MTAAPLPEPAGPVDERLAPVVTALLEQPAAGQRRVDAVLRHQVLLDALDRADLRRMVVWPESGPVAVAHLSTTGTLTVAGAAEAGPHLASYMASSGWRVLLGDAPLSERLIQATGRGGLRRRKVHAREQRLMGTTAPARLEGPDRLRLARQDDVDVLTDFACRLHVEDRMGPPLTRHARSGVAERMRASVERSQTWVAEQDGTVTAKFDVSLRTRRRGAQIAGVFVAEPWRGQGIAGRGVAALAGNLMSQGLVGVTLHVRADNTAGRRAYARAGFTDRGPWLLALR